MLEKGKISSGQMGVMLFFAIVATAVLTVPGITGKYAKNDLWLSPIWGSLVGYLTVFVAYRLHKFYPKQSIIQYSESIVGRVPGKMIGFLVIVFYLHLTGLIVRSYAEFIVGNYLILTPISVVIISMVVINAMTVRGGVEVLGRAAQLFLPVFLFPILFMPLLIPDMKLEFLFPFLEHGLTPSLMGAILPQAWFSEMFLMTFLLPLVTDGEKGMRSGLISVLGLTMLLTLINLFILLVLGKQAEDFLYPVMIVFRYISVADFLENLESVVMAIWVLGAFLKISVFYYATVLGTSQWLRLSDYRPIVWPIGLLIILLSFWSLPDFLALSRFDVVAFPFYGPLIQTLIPLFLLIIASLRKKTMRPKQWEAETIERTDS
jgi:spore germination protein KB